MLEDEIRYYVIKGIDELGKTRTIIRIVSFFLDGCI